MSEERLLNSPINEESPFSFDELFFSRTDTKGIILAGNSVFQRVSIYSWDALLRKPHNVIRHPDMPKGVFYLLWQTIKKAEPIGAYVKNMSQDGRYYWVYAIITPIENGFLSVRLKPSSVLMPIVEQEYKKLLAEERVEKISPSDSAKKLLERLALLGFYDYSEFMAAALSKEIEARNAKLNRPIDSTVACFNELTHAAQTLLKKADIIFSAYETNEYVPLNLQIQSAQLGIDGVSIGVISSNYNIISTEIKHNMDSFLTSVRQVFKTINDGLFLICTADIQKEVKEFFSHETVSENISLPTEMAHLDQQQNAYRIKAIAGLKAILQQTEQFQSACRDMKMLASGLEVTRVMGKVESARQVVSKDGLDQLIDDLGVLQSTISDSLKEIDHMNLSIRYNTQKLLLAV